jgi:hypothetical protein
MGRRLCTSLHQKDYRIPGRFTRSFPSAILLAVLLVCGNACTKKELEQGPFVKDLLNDVPCAVPCWQGINFGQTTEQEVMDVLVHTLGEYDVKPYTSHNEAKGEVTVRWATRDADVPRGVSTLSELVIVSNIAHHMNLVLDTGLTVQMVIDKWGEPTVFFVQETGRHPLHIWITLCYPALGAEFSAYLDSEGESMTLDPEDAVVFARLYAQMSEEQWRSESLQYNPWRWRPTDPTKILKWTGFGAIPADAID